MTTPSNTVKAYKLFRVNEKHPGKLFPLFVNSNTPLEIGKWHDAESGEQTESGKVKSKIGDLAYRPGFHSGDLPVATHIGGKISKDDKKPSYRPDNHVWAEVEVPNDVDWQTEANKRGVNPSGKLIAAKAHITDQLPIGGHYRYKTNPNMTGNWLISGSMKINRIVSDEEVKNINNSAGTSDLPRLKPFDHERYGFQKPQLQESSVTNIHHITMGRMALVDRIRGGVLQMRHLVSEQAGYKILDGSLVRMTPQEQRRRKRAARISARKRRSKEAAIIRAQHLSLRKRAMRLGS